MESSEKKAALQLELAGMLLKYQLGVDHNTPVTLTDSLLMFLSGNLFDADTSFNIQNRHEFRLLNMLWTLRGYEARSVRAAYLPSLSGYAGSGFNAQRQQFDIFDFNEKWFDVAYWGLELHIPIFDSYKNGAIYKQKKLDQLKIKNDIEDFKQKAHLQVKEAWTIYKTASDDYQEQVKNLELARKIYDKVKIKYTEGVGSSLELAEAESSLTQTQSSYLNALHGVLAKKSDLMKALGNY
jgi:outer membrane protein TolC